ncbi:hypothetical protein BD324DRAFT_117647 [Kockovaella imperatae]|uniref:Btz domain-containing protein n=1 Tax=Kockovaella imperatae TaxID=4999 RepID=A0A1Y1UC34_9TREE|nr:hypothetical protein BD324DRAFT_117647 [Kockovaella imperatae]ORX35094.1 hypothetical protein BD324DRAFT_117647 [Kockovaella imperatae]
MAGGAAAGQRGVELAPEEPTRGKKKSGEAGELEMDKLWAEMEAKERARAERQVEQKPAEDNEADAKESVPAESASTPVEGAVASAATTSKPTVNGASKEREQKWGHEGFESMKAVDQFQSNRGFMRGRGRGRGAFAPVPGRGGVPNVFRQRFPPAFRPPFGAPTGPRSAAAQIIPAGSAIQSSSVSKTPATPSRSSSAKATEDSLTQSGLDDMIAPVSQTVTVRLPGGIEQIVKLPPATTQAQSVPIQAASQTAPSSSAPSPVPRLNSSGEFVPLSSRTPNSIPEFIPSTNPSPAPQAIPQFTGSDHGSISSAGPGPAVPIPTPGYFPQGLALGPNGEYFNLATGLPAEYSASSAPQRQFYPQQRFNHQSMQSQQFYPPPQSYSPDHFGAGAPAAPPMMNGRSNTSTGPSNHQHHPSMQMSAGSYPSPAGQGVYFSPIPQDGRGSPFSPYSPGPMGSSAANGFFAPPQSRKVSIKAPTTNSEEVQGKDAQGSNPSGVKPNSDAAQAAQSAQYLAAQAAVAQGYNPYASINGGYPGEMMNGNTTNGMMSMNGGGGQHGMYYNQWQGQGGAGMGGGQPEYGYAEYGY